MKSDPLVTRKPANLPDRQAGKLRGFLISSFLVIFSFASFAQPITSAVSAREYLPGDFVHVVVDAPVDTAQITAQMPDGTTISLVQQRVTRVWRGIWQVPIDFAQGTYTAKLAAVDIAGNIFEGQTDPFTIGQLAMVTLVGKPTQEAAPTEKAPLKEKISIETGAPTAGEAELLNRIMKVIGQPSTTPAPELEKEAKQILIETNLQTGKDFFNKANYSRAAAYFRIVLYLAPNNREAALFLSQSEDLLKQQQAAQKAATIWLVVYIILGLLLLAGILWYVWYVFSCRLATMQGVRIPQTVTEKEKIALWFSRVGWSKDPFSSSGLIKLFSGGAMEREGLRSFIQSRINSIGGKVNPFTASAVDKIFELSKGKPQTALKICSWGVVQAIALGSEQITAEIIKGYERVGLRNILVADDEEIIRTSLEAILKRGGGYETDTAADGEEALKKIKENLYGLVLLDIEMPKIDGYEILRQARLIYPDLPIIFVTGKGTPQQTMESISKFNLTGYVEKPFTPEKILDVVARTLK